MRQGGTCPDAFVAALRLQIARLPNNGKSVVIARAAGDVATMEVARPRRRFFGAIGAPAKRGAFMAGNDASIAPPPM